MCSVSTLGKKCINVRSWKDLIKLNAIIRKTALTFAKWSQMNGQTWSWLEISSVEEVGQPKIGTSGADCLKVWPLSADSCSRSVYFWFRTVTTLFLIFKFNNYFSIILTFNCDHPFLTVSDGQIKQERLLHTYLTESGELQDALKSMHCLARD